MGLLERFRLDGKVAIVTGAGRGVGEGIARALADGGATVVCSARKQNELDRTVAQITGAGGKAISITANVLKEPELQGLVDQTLEKLGRIDIVVNNAGGNIYRPFLEISADEFKHHYNWNTVSAFTLSRIATPPMLAQGGGAILNISSGAGHIGIRGMMSYCAAKAGLDQLTKAMGEELAPHIRVNCLALGAIMTPGLQTTFDLDPDFRDKLLAKTPLRKLGNPTDVGLAALFLCSPAAELITGTVLRIDGGLQDTNLPFRLPDLSLG